MRNLMASDVPHLCITPSAARASLQESSPAPFRWRYSGQAENKGGSRLVVR
jgi:hypothetical protein